MHALFHAHDMYLKARPTGETAPVCQEQFLFIFTPCRSEKESLQSSLLQARQHVSELEITRSRLEAQVRTAARAQEAILGESLVCFVSGDGPA